MRNEHRSRCPINLSLEVLGDRWSLLILRDMMFAGKRHFREFLRSEEGISSNILADRLGKLSEEGMVTKAPDPTHKRKAIYTLTEKSIALVPVFVQLGVWGSRHLPASEELSASAWVLEEGGPRMWERFMSELREEHIGPPDGGGSVPIGLPDLRFAIEDVIAEEDKVVLRVGISATHKGELLGIPPTNGTLSLTAIEIYRLDGGKVDEQWVNADTLGMMQQLGAIPTPG